MAHGSASLHPRHTLKIGLGTLEGHVHGVNACAISPDGQRIVSCVRADTTLKIWELGTGQLLSTL